MTDPLLTRVVLLDSGPLGMVTNPRANEEATRCTAWLRALLAAGQRVMVPEIAEYEVRRELIRAGKEAGERRLDELISTIGRVPIDSNVMMLAASYWAQARNRGYQTADDKSLDADVILAAQAHLSTDVVRKENPDKRFFEVIVATRNVGHLGRYVDAREWETIAP